MFKNILKKVGAPVAIIALSLVFSYFYIDHVKKAEAAVSLATLIGGRTLGVIDVCCNGIVLGFTSVQPLNPNILYGSALFSVGSQSYDHGNEFSAGFCSLGSLIPNVCVDIESECESSSYMPQVNQIGTGASFCTGPF